MSFEAHTLSYCPQPTTININKNGYRLNIKKKYRSYNYRLKKKKKKRKATACVCNITNWRAIKPFICNFNSAYRSWVAQLEPCLCNSSTPWLYCIKEKKNNLNFSNYHRMPTAPYSKKALNNLKPRTGHP